MSKNKNKNAANNETKVAKEKIEKIEEEKEEVVEDLIDEKDLKIKALEEEVSDLKNKYAMAYADTENTRKRLQQEADNLKKYRIQSFATDILPVLDNLERALASDENKKDDAFYKGVKMIYDQLLSSLEKEGISVIDCLDKKFDPNVANAIAKEKVEGKESEIVIDVLQKGYMLKDRVLRPAMVKISE